MAKFWGHYMPGDWSEICSPKNGSSIFSSFVRAVKQFKGSHFYCPGKEYYRFLWHAGCNFFGDQSKSKGSQPSKATGKSSNDLPAKRLLVGARLAHFGEIWADRIFDSWLLRVIRKGFTFNSRTLLQGPLCINKSSSICKEIVISGITTKVSPVLNYEDVEGVNPHWM